MVGKKLAPSMAATDYNFKMLLTIVQEQLREGKVKRQQNQQKFSDKPLPSGPPEARRYFFSAKQTTVIVKKVTGQKRQHRVATRKVPRKRGRNSRTDQAKQEDEEEEEKEEHEKKKDDADATAEMEF